MRKMVRYSAEYVDIINTDGSKDENVLTVWDNYFEVSLRMDKIGDVNELVNNLNIANRVLGDEFEALYE